MFSRQPCPLCGELFHIHALQLHVNSCLDKQGQASSSKPGGVFGRVGAYSTSINSLHRKELESSAQRIISESLQKEAPIPIPFPTIGSFVAQISANASSTPPFLDVGVVLSTSLTDIKVGFIRNLSTLEQIIGSLPGSNYDPPSLNLHKPVSIETVPYGERKTIIESTQLVLGELVQSHSDLSWKRSFLHPLHPLKEKPLPILLSSTLIDNDQAECDLLTIDGIVYQPLQWLGKDGSKFRAYYAVPDVFHSYGILPLHLPCISLQCLQSLPRSISSTLFARAVEVLSAPDSPSSTLGGKTWITIEFEDDDEFIDSRRHTLRTDSRSLCPRPVFFSSDGLCDCDKDHAALLESLSTAADKDVAKTQLREQKFSNYRKKRLMNAATALSSGGLSCYFSKCRCQTAWFIQETCGSAKVIIRLWRRTTALSKEFVFAEGSLELKSLTKAQVDRLCALAQKANEESQVVCASVPPCLLQLEPSESSPTRNSLKRSRPFRSLPETVSSRSMDPSLFEVEEGYGNSQRPLRQQLYSNNDGGDFTGLSVGDVLLRALGENHASIAMKAAIFNERRVKPVAPQGPALAVDRIAAAISTLSGKERMVEKKRAGDNPAVVSSRVSATPMLMDVSAVMYSDREAAPLSTLIGAQSIAETLFNTTSRDGLTGDIALPSFAPPPWRLTSPLNPISSTFPSLNEKILSILVDVHGKVTSVQQCDDMTKEKPVSAVLLDPALLDICVTLRKPGPQSLVPQPVRHFDATEKYTSKTNESVFRVQFRYVTASDVSRPYGIGAERSQPLMWSAISGHHALLSILLRHFDFEVEHSQLLGKGVTSSSLSSLRVSSLRRSDGLSVLDLATTSASADHTRCVGILIKHFHVYNKERGGRSRISPFTSSSDPTRPEGENSVLSRNSLHFAVLGGSTIVVQLVARLQKLFQKQHDARGHLPLGLAFDLMRPYLSVVLVGPHGWSRGGRNLTSNKLSETIRQMFPWANPFELLLPPEFGFASFRLTFPFPHGQRRVTNGTWSLGAAPEVLAANVRGVTPLLEFAAKGNKDAVAILLHLGANVYDVFHSSGPVFVTGEVSLREGDTPLHSVVQFFIANTCGQKRAAATEIINLLLGCGAGLLSRNSFGDTVLHDLSRACVSDASQDLVNLLRFFLNRVFKPTYQRETATQWLQKKTTNKAVESALGWHTPHDFQNNAGRSPMDEFCFAGGSKLKHPEVYGLLSVFLQYRDSTTEVHQKDEMNSLLDPVLDIETVLETITTPSVSIQLSASVETIETLTLPLPPLPKLGALLFGFMRQPYINIQPLLRHSCSTCGAKTTSILDVRLMNAPWLNPPCRSCGSVSSHDLRGGEQLDERWRAIAAQLSSALVTNDPQLRKKDPLLIKSALVHPSRLSQRILDEVGSLGYAVLTPDEVDVYRFLVANTVCSFIEAMGLLSISQTKAISVLDENSWSLSGSVSALVTDLIEDRDTVNSDDASSNAPTQVIPTAPNGETFSCMACLEDVDVAESFSLSCSHRFCVTCWKAHLSASLEREGGPEGIALVQCLAQPECKEKVNEEAWRLCADPRTFDLYKRWRLKGFSLRNKRLIACGNPSTSGCSNFFLLSREGLSRSDVSPLDESTLPPANSGKAAVALGLQILRNVDLDKNLPGDLVSVARCSCGYIVCVHCGLEAHSPATCRDVIRWRELVSDETDASSIRLLLSTTKKCPNCSAFIFRDGGCPHIKCASCRHEFCHTCRAPWTGYDHRCKPEFSELTPMAPLKWNNEEGLSMEERSALGRRNGAIIKSRISSNQVAEIQEKKRLKDLRRRYEITSIEVGTQSAAQDFITRRIQSLSSSILEKSFQSDLGILNSVSGQASIANIKHRRDIESRVHENKRISNSLNELRSSMRFVLKTQPASYSFRNYNIDDSRYLINLLPENVKMKRAALMVSLSASWARIVSVAHYIALAFADKDALATWRSIAPLFHALLDTKKKPVGESESIDGAFDLCCSSSSWDFILRNDGAEISQNHGLIPWIDVISSSEIVSELLVASDFLPTNATSGSDLLQIALASGVCSALASTVGISTSTDCDKPLRQPWFQCLDCAEAFVGQVDFNEFRSDRSSGAGASPIKEVHNKYWRRTEGPLDDKIGICASCAMTCHRGHSLRYLGVFNRSCQCGQGLCRALLPPSTEALPLRQTVDVGGRIAFLPSLSRSLSLFSSTHDSTSLSFNDDDIRSSLRLVHGCVAIVPGLLANSTLTCARALILQNVAELSGQKTLEPTSKSAAMTLEGIQSTWQELREEDELLVKKRELLRAAEAISKAAASPEGAMTCSKTNSLLDTSDMPRTLRSSREVLLTSLLQFISSSRFLQNALVRTMYLDFDNHWNLNITSSERLRIDLFKHRIQLLKLVLDDLFSCSTPLADGLDKVDITYTSRTSITGVDISRVLNLSDAAKQLCRSLIEL